MACRFYVLIYIAFLYLVCVTVEACVDINIVASCLQPIVNCISNTTLNGENPGFGIEFLNQTLNNISPQIFCPISSITLVTSQTDLLSFFNSYNSSSTGKVLIGISGVSNSLLTSTFMKSTLPYAYSSIRAYGSLASTREPIQITALSFFIQPVFYEFLCSWILLSLIFANILWCAERKNNFDNFPIEYFGGIFNSFYFSSVTSSTVGYGDKSPKTTLGKAMVLIWILTSFLLVFLFNAVATSTITLSQIRNVPETISQYSGRTVATIPHTSSADLLYAAGADVVYVTSTAATMEYFSKNTNKGLLVYDQLFLASNFTNIITPFFGLVGPAYDKTEYSFLLQKSIPEVDEYLTILNEWILRTKTSSTTRQLTQRYLQQTLSKNDAIAAFLDWLPFIILGSLIICISIFYIVACIITTVITKSKLKKQTTQLEEQSPTSTLELQSKTSENTLSNKTD